MTGRTRHRAGPGAMAGTAAAVVVALGSLLLAALVPGAAPAQIADTTVVPVDSVVVTPGADARLIPARDTTQPPITPRGAFIRSMVIPGWGQAAFGSYTRGSVYFAGWAGNWYMLFRNQIRLDDARDRYDLRAEQIEAQLLAESENPDSLRQELERDPTILEDAIRADEGPGGSGNNLRKLVRAREQQREDWIAWSIFWLLASGVDGYVTAHLNDLPTGIDVRANTDRSISVGLQVPLPGGRP